jgi:hypothetical protein
MPPPAILHHEQGPSWVVCFEFNGDRYHHRIAWRARAGGLVPLLTSREGEAGDTAQPSPPLQQLHLQTVNASPVAFGVGMSGGCHSSCSVSLTGIHHNDLLFEYAVSGRGDLLPPRCTWVPDRGVRIDNGSASGAEAGTRSLDIVHSDSGLQFNVQLDGCQPVGPEEFFATRAEVLAVTAPALPASKTTRWSVRLKAPAE